MVRWVSSLLPGQRLMSDRSRSQNLFARRRKSLGNPAGSSSSEAGAVDRSFTREASGVGTGSVFTVGIAGPSGGGKSSVTRIVTERLEARWSKKVAVISLDDFYLGLRTPEERAKPEEYNFDRPAAFDWDLATKVLTSLKTGQGAAVPTYSFANHARLEPTVQIEPNVEVVLFEGIMAFSQEHIRDLLDLKVFVDTDADECLARRVKRDCAERGRTVEEVLNQYLDFVKPGNQQFVLPSRLHSDLIIPLGANPRSVDVLVHYLEKHLTLNQEEMRRRRKGVFM